jgi:hypothetical protein
MTLAHIFLALWVLAPGSAIYVKGHSQAAERARENIENLTCYTSGAAPETSAGILEIDHILANSGGRSWVVMVLTDGQQHVLYEGKAEEFPWPIPSSLNRLMKGMAKSTCPGNQNLQSRKPSAQPRRNAYAPMR